MSRPRSPMAVVFDHLEARHGLQVAQAAREGWQAYWAGHQAYYSGSGTQKPMPKVRWLRTQLIRQGLALGAIDAALAVYRDQQRRLAHYTDRVRTFEALQARLAAAVERYGEQHPAVARTRVKLEQLQVELWT